MPAFEFVARDREGRLQRGREEGLTANSVVSTLRGRGWAVVDVRPIDVAGAAPSWQSLRPSQWLRVRSIDIELSLAGVAQGTDTSSKDEPSVLRNTREDPTGG